MVEEATYEQAKKEAIGSGKGIAKGKPRRHWSAPLTYTSYANPFPYELDVLSVERIAFRVLHQGWISEELRGRYSFELLGLRFRNLGLKFESSEYGILGFRVREFRV